MPRRVVSQALLCLLVFAGQAAQAAPGEKDQKKELKKAEAVLSKLRGLEEATGPADRDSFAGAARGLYPDLFTKVSALREGHLKTELATAVAFYESAWRVARRGGGGAADCSRELRESYARLCRGANGGDRAALLRAKARLHARRAEAELLYARGDRGDETLDAVSLTRAERGTDRALAAEALQSLRELVGGSGVSARAEDLGGRLDALDRVLASLPRDRTQRLLCEARDAFRDGLYWHLKAAPALSLFVDASAFAPRGELPPLGLRADDASRAAQANLRAALRYINRAEEELVTVNGER